MAKVEKEVEAKKVEVLFCMTEEDVTRLDVLFKTALQAHAQGMLDYKSAFLKTIETVKSSLVRKEF